ncbi:MAG TPA: hypothetical protein VGS11_10565 [Candidatus Bathyarchaeia archaeon]|nr:hypothetical protein [Candidatus Bathyarchaeia archaeon]
MRRRNIAIVLGMLGMAFGFGSITVISQDYGSCPEQPVGSPFTCDHAYLINGAYVWMRPLYTGLGISSLAFLASAIVLALYLKLGSRPSIGPPTETD